MNICFVENYGMTYLWHEIAKGLIKKDNTINVFWVTTKEHFYNYLLKFYDSKNVLYISKKYALKNNKPIKDFKINELIYGDRVLKYEIDWGSKFLINIQGIIYNFIKNNKISYIFGEVTWAHEILIHRICWNCPELDCRYISPHTIRIPNNRFAFFIDEFLSKFIEFNKEEQEIIDIKKEFIISKPDYYYINTREVMRKRKIYIRLMRLIKFFFKKRDKFDPTLLNRKVILISLRIQEELNRELYFFIRKYKNLDNLKDKKIIFFPLHKQPEASIDISGRYYENQMQNILNIWRIMPIDWVLLVKEHPNAIGDRGIFFYKKLLKYPNLFLVDEQIDSLEIIRRSKLVVTVSGTVAYEAALLKIPSVTFSKVFFNLFPWCRNITLNDLKDASSIYDIIPKIPNNDDDILLKLKSYILRNTFKGIIMDPMLNIKVLEPLNINNLVSAFYFLLSMKT